MAEDIDKFVLRYEVDSGKAADRLEQLNKAVESVNKQAHGVGKEFKKLGSSITTEMGNVAPALNTVKSMLSEITAGFGAAGIAAAGFGAAAMVALKMALATREQINGQRLASRDSGIGMLRLEDLQHKLVGGNVSRGTVADSLKGSQDFLRRAYSDTSRSGPENRVMSMLGIRQGTSPMSNLAFNQQLATRWHGMDPSQVQAEAQMLGMNKDYALSIAKQGAALSTVSLSGDEVKQRQAAIENTAQFNTELAKFNEEMTRLSTTVGGFVIGPLANLLEGINKSIEYARKEHGPIGTGMGDIPVGEGDFTGGEGLAAALRGDGKSGPQVTQDVNETARLQREAAKAAESKAAADKQAAQKAVEADDSQNDELQSIVSQFQLAINAFSDSVTSFSGITTDKQAWAAWAGEVGRASGLGTGNNPSLGQPGDNRGGGFTFNGANASAALTGASGSSQFDSIINAAAAKHGISPDILRGIIGAESSFNPNKHSDSSFGLAGINKVNWAAYGLNDSNWTDPTANINAGAAIYSDMLKRAKGDQVLALRYYNGGFDKSQWGPQNAAYPAKVLGGFGGAALTGPLANAWDPNAKPVYGFTGDPKAAKGGWSKSTIQMRGVASSAASALGVPLQQLMMGGVPQADIAWVLSNRLSELLKQHASIEATMNAPIANPAARTKLMTDMKTNELSISNLRTYGAQVMAMGGAGDRQFSLGVTQPVTINVNGATDPEKVAVIVEKHLERQYQDVANSMTTSFKR